MMWLIESEVELVTICPQHRKRRKCWSPFHNGKNPVIKHPKRVAKDLSEAVYAHLGKSSDWKRQVFTREGSFIPLASTCMANALEKLNRVSTGHAPF